MNKVTGNDRHLEKHSTVPQQEMSEDEKMEKFALGEKAFVQTFNTVKRTYMELTGKEVDESDDYFKWFVSRVFDHCLQTKIRSIGEQKHD